MLCKDYTPNLYKAFIKKNGKGEKNKPIGLPYTILTLLLKTTIAGSMIRQN